MLACATETLPANKPNTKRDINSRQYILAVIDIAVHSVDNIVPMVVIINTGFLPNRSDSTPNTLALKNCPKGYKPSAIPTVSNLAACVHVDGIKCIPLLRNKTGNKVAAIVNPIKSRRAIKNKIDLVIKKTF